MPLAAGTRLGPYEILSTLGAGGMGEVYRARDSKLDRDVAIKVLPESVAGDSEALARFEREAKAVAALSHQNILSIFDFGAQGGVSYAVMELLEGETLRAKLEAGSISQKQAVDYALQMAKGLSAAHERGIVHRDLKPENVFVARDGHLKILDFGLAKKSAPAAPGRETSAPTESGHTEPGTVMGTVGYMSPEQVRGLAVDHRSDIFSFGAILYELLSGQRAFRRATAADTMSAILKEHPSDLSGPGGSVPAALDHIARHCLEKDRDDRFQSARDIAFALTEASSPDTPVVTGVHLRDPRRMSKMAIAGGAASVAVAAAAALLLFRRPPEVPRPAEGVKRVAVLPFENLGSREDDYFADGIADAVRGKLTALSGVEVIARGSSMPYRKTTKTPRQISEELEARYLLTATVRWQKSGERSRVLVTPELVEVTGPGPPTSRWQEPFDASLTDVFQVQADIASRVAQALGVALGEVEERRLSEKPTRNLAAYDAYLKGQEVWRSLAVGDPPGVRKALGFFEQAVALDPEFAEAWARISWGNSVLYANSGASPAFADRAKRAAEKAVAIAPDRPEGHHALGNYRRLVLKDYEGALEEYTRGRRVDPANADLLTAAALAVESLGRWDVALEHLREAERLDPRSIPARMRLGQALLYLRKHGEARQAAQRDLALAPGSLPLIVGHAMTFLAQGDLAGAQAVLRGLPKEVEPTALVAYVANSDLVWLLDEEQRELLLRLTPVAFDEDRASWAICLTQAHALRADRANTRLQAEEARKALVEQVRAAPEDAQRQALLGLALAYLGRSEEAIREGERAVAMLPLEKDGLVGPYIQHQLARIYLLSGRPEEALDRLEPLLRVPYVLSPGWLKIDPTFDPLRKHPRFQKLVAGA